MASAASKPKKHASLLAATLILLLLFLVGWQLTRIHSQLAAAQDERDSLAARIATQEQENRSLEAALDRAEDPEYLQELAREELGMVSPGQKDFYDVSN